MKRIILFVFLFIYASVSARSLSDSSGQNSSVSIEPELWMYFGAFTLSAFLGGIAGYLIFNRIFVRNKSEYLRLTDRELASEIINLRTRIQTVYIVGPLAAFILAFFGLKSLDEIRALNSNQVKKDLREILIEDDLAEAFENLKESKKDLKLLVQGSGLITKNDLSDYIKQTDFRRELIEIDKKIPEPTANYNFSPIIRNYLSQNKFIDEQSIELILLSYMKKQDFDSYSLSIQNILSGLDDRFIDNDYLPEVEDYLNKKSEFVLRSELQKYFTEAQGESLQASVNRIEKNYGTPWVNNIIANYLAENLKKNITTFYPWLPKLDPSDTLNKE